MGSLEGLNRRSKGLNFGVYERDIRKMLEKCSMEWEGKGGRG